MNRKEMRERKVDVEVEKALLRARLQMINELLKRRDTPQAIKTLIQDAIYPLYLSNLRVFDWIEQIENEVD